jgi:hypothetical protein
MVLNIEVQQLEKGGQFNYELKESFKKNVYSMPYFTRECYWCIGINNNAQIYETAPP